MAEGSCLRGHTWTLHLLRFRLHDVFQGIHKFWNVDIKSPTDHHLFCLFFFFTQYLNYQEETEMSSIYICVLRWWACLFHSKLDDLIFDDPVISVQSRWTVFSFLITFKGFWNHISTTKYDLSVYWHFTGFWFAVMVIGE